MGQAPTYRPATGIRRTRKGLLRACRRLLASGHQDARLHITIHCPTLGDSIVVRFADDCALKAADPATDGPGVSYTIEAVQGV